MTRLNERRCSAAAQATQIARATGACVLSEAGIANPTWLITYGDERKRRVLVTLDHGVLLLPPRGRGEQQGLVSRVVAEFQTTTTAIKWLRAERTIWRRVYRRVRWGRDDRP
jgi:hypothetical protein